MKLNTTVSRIALSLALAVGIAAAGSVMAPVAIAAEKKPTVSPAVGKPLLEAQAMVTGGKPKEAIPKANEAIAAAKTPYEQLIGNQVLVTAALKAGDLANAAKGIEGMLATGQAPEPQQMRKTLIQIHYQAKDYPKTAEAGQAYLKESPNDPEIAVLVGQAYYLQNDFKRTAEFFRAFVKASDSAGRPVKEDTLNLLMSADYKLQDDNAVRQDLEMLVARYPKPQYLKDLVSMTEKAIRANNPTTKTTLDLYVVKFNAGLVTTPADYAQMAQLALADGLPGLAKKVMDKGVADGVLGTGPQKDREARMLTMANTQAATDEKGLSSGEAEAAKAKTGDALIKYGEAYASYGQFDKAIAATEAGIAKTTADKDDSQLRLGIVYMQAGQRAKALEAFKSITPGTTSAQLASLWRLQK